MVCSSPVISSSLPTTKIYWEKLWTQSWKLLNSGTGVWLQGAKGWWHLASGTKIKEFKHTHMHAQPSDLEKKHRPVQLIVHNLYWTNLPGYRATILYWWSRTMQRIGWQYLGAKLNGWKTYPVLENSQECPTSSNKGIRDIVFLHYSVFHIPHTYSWRGLSLDLTKFWASVFTQHEAITPQLLNGHLDFELLLVRIWEYSLRTIQHIPAFPSTPYT